MAVLNILEVYNVLGRHWRVFMITLNAESLCDSQEVTRRRVQHHVLPQIKGCLMQLKNYQSLSGQRPWDQSFRVWQKLP